MNKTMMKSTRGSTLTWVMVVSIVLTLLIVSILAVISYNIHSTNLSRTQTQAYYTAQSVNERIVNWLSGTPSPDETLNPDAENYDDIKDPYDFINDLIDAFPNPEVQNYAQDDLGANMGTATTTVAFTNEDLDEIKITTTATFAGVTESLSVLMYLQQVTDFNSVNTTFDYNDPGISATIAEVGDVSTWEQQAVWAKQYSSGSWWSYFLNVYNDGIVDYRMDLLAITPADFTGNPPTIKHDYSYRYLQNNNFPGDAGKQLVRINLNPSRGAFLLTQVNQSPASNIPDVAVGSALNPVVNFPFPYNNTAMRSAAKGVLLTISGVGGGGAGETYNVAHDKIVYYTLDHPGFAEENWPSITLTTTLGFGTTPPPSNNPLTYKNLSIYLTDSSEKTFDVNSGIVVTSGTMYTKRGTNIGTVFDDTGQTTAARTALSNYSKTVDLVFETYNFIFANPGDGQEQRQSRISGTANAGGTSKTYMNNGSILVQGNHELTIGDGAVINAQDNKGIVVEAGGSLVIEGGANITGNIYVANGATLTINPSATTNANAIIRGNIFCSGTLAVNSSFTLNNLDANQTNIDLGYTTSMFNNATGIFIYNDVKIGVGSLTVSGNPIISSSSGVATNKIHTFVPYPSYSRNLFCSHADEITHVCGEWDSDTYVWSQRSGSIQEVRGNN